MIIVDLNQVMISNLMMQIGNDKNATADGGLIRHMVLNTLRMNRTKFTKDYGELVIACDDKNYWRKKVFPYYKSQRKQWREDSKFDWGELFSIMNSIRDELKEYFPYRVIHIETAEADDIVATLCHRFGSPLDQEPKILILSGDKDFIQLQKYGNVSQYDPTRKKWIKHISPKRYMFEHIIRGDRGDGVPNVLSPDDAIVSKSRQKPITAKKLDHYINVLMTGKTTPFEDHEMQRNWFRNLSVISLDMIPHEIARAINESYDEQEHKEKDRSKIFNYFIKYRLKHMMENIQEF